MIEVLFIIVDFLYFFSHILKLLRTCRLSIGELHIVDRCKDMVLVGGFNVFPNEVDGVLSTCAGVTEAAAAGIRTESGSEELHAFVVTSDPDCTAESVLAHCRNELTGYKVPRKVHFIEELPKNPIGKILRRHLQDHA